MLIAYLVLAAAFVLEGISWLRAVQQVRAESAAENRTLREYLRLLDDPTVKTVFFEDSAALVGLLLAFGGLALHDVTGYAFWDGLASVLIGVLLAFVAYLLGRTNKGLLIGRQADPAVVRGVRGVPGRGAGGGGGGRPADDGHRHRPHPAVRPARLRRRPVLVSDLENACVRIAGELSDRFPDLDEIFLEPVPRSDPNLRARVLARYGPRPPEHH